MLNRYFFAWLLIALFYAYQYILRVMPNITASLLMPMFGVGITEIGRFSGLYYAGYTIAHIPVGILLDKYGSKNVISISAAIAALAGFAPLILGGKETWIYSEIGRFVMGMASVSAALGIFKVSNAYYHGASFTRMTSIAVVIGLIGAFYGGMPMSALIEYYGWQTVMRTLMIIGLIIAASIFFILPKNRRVEEEDHGSLSCSLKEVCSNKFVFLLPLCGGLMVGPLQGFADSWASTFLQTVYAMDSSAATLLPSFIFAGMGIGLLTLSSISPKKYYRLTQTCAVIMLVSFIILLGGHIKNTIFVATLMLLIGFSSSYQIFITCQVIAHAPRTMVAIATALSNMIIMGFGYIYNVIISKIISLYWTHELVDGLPVYSESSLIKGLSVIAIGIFIAFIMLIWLEREEINIKKHTIN